MWRNGLEPWHLLIVLAIVLLMFGSTKLPDLARGMGSSIRIFKSELDKNPKEATEEPAAQLPAAVGPEASAAVGSTTESTT